MKSSARFSFRFLAFVPVVALALAPVALAQRKVIGGDDDEDKPADAGPPPAKATPPATTTTGKKDDKKKKPDDKKPDDKKPDAKADAKGGDAKKPDDKAVAKKPVDDKHDVLADTPAEKIVKSKEDEAREKADKAADDAAKKKEAEQKKLVEQKKLADDKRKLENKDQRLAAAKRIRQISRTSGAVSMSFAVEPGYVQSNSVVEVRMDLAEKLEVPDPRYGNLMPLKGLELTAVVTQQGKKLRYALHPLEAPGRYGFHTTPLKDGVYVVSVDGTTKDNKSFSASFPLHVGTWPPPDFDDEEKNNLASDAGKGGRKVVGDNN